MTYLNESTHKVTALVTSPEYVATLSVMYGVSNSVSGSVDLLGWVTPEAFDASAFQDSWPVVNIRCDSLDGLGTFTNSKRAIVEAGFAFPMVDALEQLLHRMRPYELVSGSVDAAFEHALDQLIESIEKHGLVGARSGFKKAINTMRGVRCDLSHRRPRVLIVGEYLLNFHPGANRDIERYLEANGLEVIEARMSDVLQKTYFYRHAQVNEFHVDLPLTERLLYAGANEVCRLAHAQCDAIASQHPLYEAPPLLEDLVKPSDPLMHHTFDAGEGVLIPAEIIHHAERGCKAFVILQPFGCLPNHVCGRGMSKRLKELYPDVQILPLDYDPDMSQANIENRLQMLVMSAKAG